MSKTHYKNGMPKVWPWSGSHRIVSALRAVEAWLREDGAL